MPGELLFNTCLRRRDDPVRQAHGRTERTVVRAIRSLAHGQQASAPADPSKAARSIAVAQEVDRSRRARPTKSLATTRHHQNAAVELSNQTADSVPACDARWSTSHARWTLPAAQPQRLIANAGAHGRAPAPNSRSRALLSSREESALLECALRLIVQRLEQVR